MLPQIFASNWKISHLVSGRRQMTSQCAFGQLSVVHSRSDGRKVEGRTDNAKTISPLENPLPRYAPGRKVYLSTMYIWKLQRANSISSWYSATKLGVSRPHMQIHIPVKRDGRKNERKGLRRTNNANTTPPPPAIMRRGIKTNFIITVPR